MFARDARGAVRNASRVAGQILRGRYRGASPLDRSCAGARRSPARARRAVRGCRSSSRGRLVW